MKGLDSPLSAAVASVLSEVAWCSGTFTAPKDDLRVYYGCPTDTDPHAARSIDFSDTENSVEQLEALAQQCQPASFGRGQQDVQDPSYRKAGKLDTTQFSTPFNLAGSGILDVLKDEMLIKHDLRAELYKLNVYDKGCFFKTHKDTPRSEDMIASLVIVFPTAHEGGSLVLRHGGKELDFNSGKELSGSKSKVAYVAFFSDTDHEVTEVTSGHRVTLTYNLYISRSKIADVQTKTAQQDEDLLKALQKVLDSSDTPQLRLGFGLQHQYAFSHSYLEADTLNKLKGSDAALLRACKKLNLKCSPYVLYFDKYRDEEDGQYFLSSSFISDGEFYDEDYEGIWEGTENVAKSEDLLWVTNPQATNHIENHYVTYGNEPSMGYAYGNIVVVAKRS